MSIKNYVKTPYLILFFLISCSAFFMLYAAANDSPTMDELAHVPAGYGYAKYLDFRLNPEHPPLVKVLSALPLTFMDVNFPTSHKSWATDVNGQWDAGTEFLYNSGNDAQKIIFFARLFPILLTILTIILIYIWSKELIGKWWGLIPALLFGFSPNIIAHGHYVTTDIGATFGTLLATYAFLSFLMNPTKSRLLFSGLALGIAELTKYSNALLIPFFFIMLMMFYLSETLRASQYKNKKEKWLIFIKRGWFYIKSFILILLITGVVIYATYFILTIGYPQEKQVSDTQTIISSFPIKLISDFNIVLVKEKLLRPFGEYMLGLLMVFQRSSGGNTGYFLGEISSSGWWYYFPIVFLIKEPLPSILLLVFALSFALVHVSGRMMEKYPKRKMFSEYLGTNFSEFSMLIFILIYVGYSMKSPLNIGVRHLMPIFPFLYILGVSGIKSWYNKTNTKNNAYEQNQTNKKTSEKIKKCILITALLIWFVFETVNTFPYFLSYFNEIGGGTKYGYQYVTDSNYDWGQDLKRLSKWCDDNKIEKIAVDYFGGGNPKYYIGNERVVYWSSSMENPRNENIEWIAISVNTLMQSFAKETNGFKRGNANPYAWLLEVKPKMDKHSFVPEPDVRIGTSIFVYHL